MNQASTQAEASAHKKYLKGRNNCLTNGLYKTFLCFVK